MRAVRSVLWPLLRGQMGSLDGGTSACSRFMGYGGFLHSGFCASVDLVHRRASSRGRAHIRRDQGRQSKGSEPISTAEPQSDNGRMIRSGDVDSRCKLRGRAFLSALSEASQQ
jgi:hypothetical protein